jgi:pyridoxamine 5'-phosphate oxidase
MQINKKLQNIRINYTKYKLDEKKLPDNPFVLFSKWFNQVLKSDILEPNAMILSTCLNNKPSSRVVLLKQYDEKGFTFFTNYNSRKGIEISKNKQAALLFYWMDFERQVRIEGKVKKISRIESEAYFNTRPLESRYSALASEQSKVLHDRKMLIEKIELLKAKYGDKPPLPDNWGGLKLYPNYFEFWQGRENRLHDRICYKKVKSSWKIFRLSP